MHSHTGTSRSSTAAPSSAGPVSVLPIVRPCRVPCRAARLSCTSCIAAPERCAAAACLTSLICRGGSVPNELIRGPLCGHALEDHPERNGRGGTGRDGVGTGRNGTGWGPAVEGCPNQPRSSHEILAFRALLNRPVAAAAAVARKCRKPKMELLGIGVAENAISPARKNK